jgi:hypothetical protein
MNVLKKGKLKMEESKKLFPVYRFSVTYEETGEQKVVDYVETLCPHEQSDDECREKINLIMDMFSDDYPEALEHISLIEFKEVSKATWRLGYYSHETFIKFANKKEAFASFRAFVNAAVKRCHDTGEDISTLEAADKEEKWKICRCKSCKEDGRTVIHH